MEPNYRLIKFRGYQAHPWYKKVYKKLNTSEVLFCLRFIEENSHTDKPSFEVKVNVLFLGVEKPKNWKEMTELLSCCNNI